MRIGVGTGGEAVTCEDDDDTWWEFGFGEEGAETDGCERCQFGGLEDGGVTDRECQDRVLKIYLCK